MIIKDFAQGTAHVRIFENRIQMGACAGTEIAASLRRLLEEKREVNVMFAAAPSQNEVLAQLKAEKGIDWNRVNAFHMDEYVGIDPANPAGFSFFLKHALLDSLPLKKIFYMDCAAQNPDDEAARYEALLLAYPTDLCVLGVGENGHIAFNDPPTADFDDPHLTKVVELTERSRIQQVNDGCVSSADLVPPYAVTVTIPGLLRANEMFCSVPGSTKAVAIWEMMSGNITTDCPASVLTRKEKVSVYLDMDSAGLLLKNSEF